VEKLLETRDEWSSAYVEHDRQGPNPKVSLEKNIMISIAMEAIDQYLKDLSDEL
jgi:hypothetical protein